MDNPPMASPERGDLVSTPQDSDLYRMEGASNVPADDLVPKPLQSASEKTTLQRPTTQQDRAIMVAEDMRPDSSTVDHHTEKSGRSATPFSFSLAPSEKHTAAASSSDHNTANHLAAQAPRAYSRYLNNLLPAVGYLDLANALDFPANVWNETPIPTFAIVLMTLCGSIAILTVGFAIWDFSRSYRNVYFLLSERAWAQPQEMVAFLDKRENGRALLFWQAWLDITFRELGWEVVDRMLTDASMGIAGILVGTGTLMAIRGDIPAVFRASNLLSGYLGNSLVVAYAFVNVLFSAYMYRRARRHHAAIKTAPDLSAELRQEMVRHGRKHERYALLNGLTIAVSSVGSMVSATMWPGYVILIPCVVGSVYCNWVWRKRLGYNRDSCVHGWTEGEKRNGFDILARLEDIREALAAKPQHEGKFRRIDEERLELVYEQRFLLELYGCYLSEGS